MSVMEPGPNETSPDRLTRRLARASELFHTVNYYTDEINRLRDDGFRGWWHGYMAYRSAPLGPVDAPLVTSVFYNFAPVMIERAVPGVWDIMAPDQVLARRNQLVAQALDRIFAEERFQPILAEAAELAQRAVHDIETAGRPLAAALCGLDWPDEPAMVLWHACTIMREHRGDSHNIALAAAGIDGVECHVLMSAAGHGNQPTITGIRGWTEEQWLAARQRLSHRDLLDDAGGFSSEGDRLRAEIERNTDRLSAQPRENLGMDDAARFYDLLSELGGHLTENGEVAGVWPPPATIRS